MKPFWASKTLIVNGVALVASVAAIYGIDIGADVQAELVGGIMAVVNIALRLVTKEPVTGRRKPGA